MIRTLLTQTANDFRPVDALNPVEALGDSARLVGLDGADEMPFQRLARNLVLFGDRLVEIVFAEPDNACGTGVLDFLCASGLADRQQRDAAAAATCALAGIGNPALETDYAFGQVVAYGHFIDAPESGMIRAIVWDCRGQRACLANLVVSLGNVMDITELLAFTVKNNASDLHLSAGLPPMIRVDGDIHRINVPAIEAKEMSDLVYSTMNDHQRRDFEADLEVDFSYNVPGLARFRVNAYHQDRGTGAAFRVIPNEIWTLEDLQAPTVFRDIIDVPRGLILVTGPTGSGKSTTLAAMVDHLNKNVAGHILTIEDPIEFVHNSKKCLINQREVKKDTLNFNAALRSALREDPDIILVGELRDTETVRLALTAAETGHVVFGTLHTSSAAKTIDRVIDVFPGEEKAMVRSMLSESLRAVVAQTLMKKVGGGRVAAHEIMIATPAIRNLIREDKVAQMYSAIQTGQNVGMTTLDQSLSELVRRGLVAKPEARRKAVDKKAFA